MRLEEPAPHPRVLRALAGEQEGDPRRAARLAPAAREPARRAPLDGRKEPLAHLDRGAPHHGEAVRQVRSPDVQRVAHVGEPLVRVRLEVRPHAVRQRRERLVAAR